MQTQELPTRRSQTTSTPFIATSDLPNRTHVRYRAFSTFAGAHGQSTKRLLLGQTFGGLVRTSKTTDIGFEETMLRTGENSWAHTRGWLRYRDQDGERVWVGDMTTPFPYLLGGGSQKRGGFVEMLQGRWRMSFFCGF